MGGSAVLWLVIEEAERRPGRKIAPEEPRDSAVAVAESFTVAWSHAPSAGASGSPEFRQGLVLGPDADGQHREIQQRKDQGRGRQAKGERAEASTSSTSNSRMAEGLAADSQTPPCTNSADCRLQIAR